MLSNICCEFDSQRLFLTLVKRHIHKIVLRYGTQLEERLITFVAGRFLKLVFHVIALRAVEICFLLKLFKLSLQFVMLEFSEGELPVLSPVTLFDHTNRVGSGDLI